jgi:hypothetical protein
MAALDSGTRAMDAASMATTDARVIERDSALPDAAAAVDAAAPDDGAVPGPNVDRGDPMLYALQFAADDADPEASESLGLQLAHLDTRVAPIGKLVVYLHGAGSAAPARCGSTEHGQMLAALGFHVLQPCYNSYYGVNVCGQDIGGCRLEAFEGVDHHAAIAITPPNAIEQRIVKALQYLQTTNPQGDWQHYLQADAPRWPLIIISGISHGASSAGLIAMHRRTDRAVMLSGPLDSGQAWLAGAPITPRDRFWGFSHTADDQHSGHLAAFERLALPGMPTDIQATASPYSQSQRLISSAATSDGHSSVQAGGSSPKNGSAYVFQPVWERMYRSP